MNNILSLTLPEGVEPNTGLQVTFRAPCACENITGLRIGEDIYKLVDTQNKDLLDSTDISTSAYNPAFTSGALVCVILDIETKRAYIQSSSFYALADIVRILHEDIGLLRDSYIPKVLSDDLYGDSLPEAGTPGRIFFLRVK